jgi:hypothetical protein
MPEMQEHFPARPWMAGMPEMQEHFPARPWMAGMPEMQEHFPESRKCRSTTGQAARPLDGHDCVTLKCCMTHTCGVGSARAPRFGEKLSTGAHGLRL